MEIIYDRNELVLGTVLNREEVLVEFNKRIAKFGTKCLTQEFDGRSSIAVTVYSNLKPLILKITNGKYLHRYQPKAFYRYIECNTEATDTEIIQVGGGFYANEEYTLMYYDWIWNKLYPGTKVQEVSNLIELILTEEPVIKIDYEKIANDKMIKCITSIIKSNTELLDQLIDTNLNMITDLKNTIRSSVEKVKEHIKLKNEYMTEIVNKILNEEPDETEEEN